MVEIEIGVLQSQCLDRRIGCRDRLIAEIAAWKQLRHAIGTRINSIFSTETARRELDKAQPASTFDKPS
ncbi:hypothetical protein [Burkholderia sp. YIM B11467]